MPFACVLRWLQTETQPVVNERFVVMTVECPRCKFEQKVPVATGRGFRQMASDHSGLKSKTVLVGSAGGKLRRPWVSPTLSKPDLGKGPCDAFTGLGLFVKHTVDC